MPPLNTKRTTILFVILLIFTLQLRLQVASATVNEADAASALTKAENDIAMAYDATADADKAGANILTLLTELNNAGTDLSQAEAAYGQGNFTLTLTLSGACSQIAEQVKIDADQLRLQATAARNTDILFRLIASMVAMMAIAVGGFLVWRLFKKRYNQRWSSIKPEGVSHGS
jgi:hypothetical protein